MSAKGHRAPGWFSVEQGAFGGSALQNLRAALIASPWLAQTTLNQRFASTWGYSCAFRRAGLRRLLKALPEFDLYFQRVLESDHNAFFLNPLVIFSGGQVHAHVDCSLRSYTAPLEPPVPRKVTVYYAQVPGGLEGGELVLTDSNGRELACIQPQPDMLVQFDGSLLHRVTPFEGSGQASLESSRMSVVCEHYQVAESLLSRVPDFHLETTRNFQDFLEIALDPDEIGNEA